jgi:hypothetical protein
VPIATEPEGTDDEALAAAYAALGNLAPGVAPVVEMQGELNSPSARVLERAATRPTEQGTAAPASIKLRELHH